MFEEFIFSIKEMLLLTKNLTIFRENIHNSGHKAGYNFNLFSRKRQWF